MVSAVEMMKQKPNPSTAVGVTKQKSKKKIKMRPLVLPELPNEMLLQIFKHLDSSRDVPKVARVCKGLRDVVLDEVFWTKKLEEAGVAFALNPNPPSSGDEEDESTTEDGKKNGGVGEVVDGGEGTSESPVNDVSDDGKAAPNEVGESGIDAQVVEEEEEDSSSDDSSSDDSSSDDDSDDDGVDVRAVHLDGDNGGVSIESYVCQDCSYCSLMDDAVMAYWERQKEERIQDLENKPTGNVMIVWDSSIKSAYHLHQVALTCNNVDLPDWAFKINCKWSPANKPITNAIAANIDNDGASADPNAVPVANEGRRARHRPARLDILVKAFCNALDRATNFVVKNVMRRGRSERDSSAKQRVKPRCECFRKLEEANARGESVKRWIVLTGKKVSIPRQVAPRVVIRIAHEDFLTLSSCYALLGPGLDSKRTKKLVARLLGHYYSGWDGAFRRRNALDFGRLAQRVDGRPPSAYNSVGHGISVMTDCGPIGILTLYGNVASRRSTAATSRERLADSRLFEPSRTGEPGKFDVRDDIKSVCDDCDGIVYAVDGGLDPMDVGNMDGLELKTFLKPLHPGKPVLVLNCKETRDSEVIPNLELAQRLGLFELPNPFAVIAVNSENVLRSGRMGFAWLRLRNLIPDVESHI